MGYRTPNIDRVANEGVTFTDYYGQQSCTAGRAAFITGQNPDPHRPDQGRHARRHGRAAEGGPDHRRAAQAARLRHRPVRQEPPRRPGRVPADRCTASTSSSATSITSTPRKSRSCPTIPRIPSSRRSSDRAACSTARPTARAGRQIEDTGPLTKKRMETIDEEITDARLEWMEKQAKAEKPFFLWYNSTAMHFRTHVAEKNLGKSGQDDYSDRMVVHDEQIGLMLDKLDELGIADNTIVMYSTDNGPENDTWPDGAQHRRSAARRTPTGRAAGACRRSFAGPARSSPARS